MFAGTSGLLDDLAVEDIRLFEEELYKFLDNSRPGVLEAVRTKKKLDDDVRKPLGRRHQGVQAEDLSPTGRAQRHSRRMPSLIDIRRRIRSVKNTQQITKAMKMVSAAKLRRAQERVIAARPYSAMMKQLMSDLALGAATDENAASSPLLAVREEKRIQL